MTATLPAPGFTVAAVYTLLNQSLEPEIQTLELKTSLQIPSFQIIGLPGPEVAEARDRVKSALESSEFDFPRKKVVLNLSPSSVRKQGTGMDLAMAVAIAADSWEYMDPIFAWGELGLDGRVKGGTHPFRALDAAFRSEARLALFPETDLQLIRDRPELTRGLFNRYPRRANLRIHGVSHLTEVLDLLRRKRGKNRPTPGATVEELFLRKKVEASGHAPSRGVGYPGVNLPASLQRWIGIASAGRHHLFLAGPRGVGKSLALEWLEALTAPPALESELQKALIHELKGLPTGTSSIRRVGTQVKPAALYGGIHGSALRPGEFTLAHGGVLIADEFPEWSRDARECFREPLERGRVTLSRVGQTYELPAEFQLAANGNLCPCGGEYSENTQHLSLRCRCLPPDRHRYLQKISGPILDRIDLLYRVPSPATRDECPPQGLAPAALFEKVESVRSQLVNRHGQPPGTLTGGQLEVLLEERPSLRATLGRLSFSSYRERHRALRAALTLAEWDGCAEPQVAHLHELLLMREEFFKRLD